MSFLHRGRGREGGPGEVLWVECPFCNEISYRKEVERHLYCCPKCDYHYPVTVEQRLQWIVDNEHFEALFLDVESRDFLKFKDEKRYADRLREAGQRSAHGEAIVFGRAEIMNWPVVLGVQDFSFLGGSMGSAVGERLVLAAEECMKTRRSLVIFAASGGARMQEGLLALMQMAKTSLALARLKDVGLPFISVLTDPTTGGVAASFAMQGDLILAEPRAMVGFAGPRVIEKTIGQKLPEGFQRAEYLLEHGLIDRIVSRRQIREALGQLIGLLAEPVASETEANEP